MMVKPACKTYLDMCLASVVICVALQACHAFSKCCKKHAAIQQQALLPLVGPLTSNPVKDCPKPPGKAKCAKRHALMCCAGMLEGRDTGAHSLSD